MIQQVQPVQRVCSLIGFQAENKVFPSCPVTYPPFFHPAHSQFSVTEVDKMNVYQTAVWIQTLGCSKGWKEAATYSRSFWENQISGQMLPEVSVKMMENDLKVKDPNHRMEIKFTIDSLFPKVEKVKHDEVRPHSGIGLYSDTQSWSASWNGQHAYNSNMEEDSSCFDSMAVDSVCSSNISTGDISRNRKLILTLPKDRVKHGQEVLELKQRFAECNYAVDILPLGWKDNSYVVVFENEKLRKEARSRAKEIGYELAKYRGRRPSPEFPVKYQALSELYVRKGKSLKQERIVKIIRKHEIITVNQAKGRRARIVEVLENGGRKNIGWVSLHTLNGESLMKRMDD